MAERRLLDPFIETYLSYLENVERKAHLTVSDVRCSLRRVGAAMAKRRPGVPLWKVAFEDYLHWMEQAREEGASEATLAKCVSQLRGLLNYAWRTGRADRNVLDGFQVLDNTSRREPSVLTLEEATRLVKACPKDTLQERRDRMIVLVFYGCGLRTKELCSLRVQDVDAQRKELFVREGKGDKQRVVPIPPAVHAELLAYLLERRAKRGPLFRTEGGRAGIRPRHACEAVRRVAGYAGLEGKVTPKTLRHTYATHLMDQGVDIGVLSVLLGHRSPKETGVYLHAFASQRHEAVRRLPTRKGDPT
ncbi:MAG TPA: tyrosine-type recombinase/integrase [Planctomycetota bacterium]|nr:tyrosine-type recombinase/integrase [Planctomycetota bacterium]